MRLRRCVVDILAVLTALLALQLCVMTAADAADEEQRAREWLEQYYHQAEQRYSAWISASWDFQVNITNENKQRLVSSRTDRGGGWVHRC